MRVLSRSEWGADPRHPRLGDPVAPGDRLEVFIHHTVVVDSDATRNTWEDLGEVAAAMRRLQVIRPDLGLDVPYNFVAFAMAPGELVLAEGRGLDRDGAHTRGRNQSALGIAFAGDFENEPPPENLDRNIAELGAWLAALRDRGFRHLGDQRPEGREVWAHQDVKATLCPGRHLLSRLGMIRFLLPAAAGADVAVGGEMDSATWKVVQRALQSLDPPLYAGKEVDGLPGRNTRASVAAFERRHGLEPRGVIGDLGSPMAGIWPATREVLIALWVASQR